MEALDKAYWNQRYVSKQTGWDVGHISTPLKEYFDQLSRKDISILIPGAGNAYEAEYLFRAGFKHITVVDWAQSALDNFADRVPDFPGDQLYRKDFFEMEGKFHMIVEQTFFCALHPALRPEYAKKASQLLKPNGKIVGLLFNIELNTDHPPFGGSSEEYTEYFYPYFNFNTWEPCYNSISPRSGEEMFINLVRKSKAQMNNIL